jgi:hypothetical protein
MLAVGFELITLLTLQNKLCPANPDAPMIDPMMCNSAIYLPQAIATSVGCLCSRLESDMNYFHISRVKGNGDKQLQDQSKTSGSRSQANESAADNNKNCTALTRYITVTASSCLIRVLKRVV